MNRGITIHFTIVLLLISSVLGGVVYCEDHRVENDDELPDYLQNWDLMEIIFSVYKLIK